MSILYTDGGVIDKNPSPIGGTWAYVLVTDDDETVIKQDSGVLSVEKLGCHATNNQMEFYALVRGLNDADMARTHIDEVKSDSNVSLGRLFQGWSITNIPDLIMQEYEYTLQKYPVRKWTNIIQMEWTLLAGHPTKAQLRSGFGKHGLPVSKWNVLCDQMCKEAGQEYIIRSQTMGVMYDRS